MIKPRLTCKRRRFSSTRFPRQVKMIRWMIGISQDIAAGTAEQNRHITSAEENKGGLIPLTLHTFQFQIRRRWKCCSLTAKPNHFGSSAEQLRRLWGLVWCFFSFFLFVMFMLCWACTPRTPTTPLPTTKPTPNFNIKFTTSSFIHFDN